MHVNIFYVLYQKTGILRRIWDWVLIVQLVRCRILISVECQTISERKMKTRKIQNRNYNRRTLKVKCWASHNHRQIGIDLGKEASRRQICISRPSEMTVLEILSLLNSSCNFVIMICVFVFLSEESLLIDNVV